MGSINLTAPSGAPLLPAFDARHTYKLVSLNLDLGEFAKVPSTGIVDIAGTSGPTFTVGGKPLLFADGTSTGPGSVSLIDLQGAYNNSITGTINLTGTKNLTVTATNGSLFSIDAITGKVTIMGDLDVRGQSVRIEGVAYNLDAVDIVPPVGNVTPLSIKPVAGVTMTSNLMELYSANDVLAVSVTPTGDLLVGNKSFLTLWDDVQTHLDPTLIAHSSSQITVDTSAFSIIAGATAQQVFADIDLKLKRQTNNISCFTWTQLTAEQMWIVPHNLDTLDIMAVVYDSAGNQMLPAELIITDSMTVTVSFGRSYQDGKIIIFGLTAPNSDTSKFEFHQIAPSTTWEITHNLGLPAPYIADVKYFIDTPNGVKDVMPYDATYTSTDALVAQFSEPQSGYAIVRR